MWTGETAVYRSVIDAEKCETAESVEVSKSPGSEHGGIGVDALGRIHLAWVENSTRVEYAILDPEGEEVAGEEIERPRECSYLTLAVEPEGRAHVVWKEGRDVLCYARFSDGALDLLRELDMGDYVAMPSVTAIPLGGAYVAFWRSEAKGWGLYLLKLGRSGDVEYYASIGKSPSVREGDFPALAADEEGFVHVVWTFRAGEHLASLRYAKLDESGKIVVRKSSLVPSTFSAYPSLALSKDGLCLSWTDGRSGTLAVFYAEMSSNGTLLSSGELASRKSLGSCCSAIVADPGGGVHVVWMEFTRGALRYFTGATSSQLDALHYSYSWTS